MGVGDAAEAAAAAEAPPAHADHDVRGALGLLLGLAERGAREVLAGRGAREVLAGRGARGLAGDHRLDGPPAARLGRGAIRRGTPFVEGKVPLREDPVAQMLGSLPVS